VSTTAKKGKEGGKRKRKFMPSSLKKGREREGKGGRKAGLKTHCNLQEEKRGNALILGKKRRRKRVFR